MMKNFEIILYNIFLTFIILLEFNCINDVLMISQPSLFEPDKFTPTIDLFILTLFTSNDKIPPVCPVSFFIIA